MNPTSSTAMRNPRNIHVGAAWFVLAAAGVAANFAGAWVWLGLGPALFVTGALTISLSWGSVALFIWLSVRWLARQEGA